jgi:hypothetical protein
MLIAAGCSDDTITPITPDNDVCEFSIPVSENNENSSNRTLWGMWSVDFNVESMNSLGIAKGLSLQAEPSRELSAHFNITSLIPPPGIVVNSYDPLTNIVDVDFTISNPYSFSGYDVRLIIFVDSVGHKLVNADDWTGLYDIAQGWPINPFKAYSKQEPNRIFYAHSQRTENLHIYLPGGNPSVTFAVDASYPGNCGEPYEICNFYQDPLYDTVGASANIAITVRDWQSDTDAVNLYCPEITGVTLVPFVKIDTETWEMDLVNETGASEGDYTGFILATSAGSGALTLYDEVTITVTTGGCTEQELYYDFIGCGDPIDFVFECQGWVAGGCGLPNSSNTMGCFKWGCDVGSPCDMNWPYITSGGGLMHSPDPSCDNIYGHGTLAHFNVVSPSIILPASDDGTIEFDHCNSLVSGASFKLYISENGCTGPWDELWNTTTAEGCFQDTSVDISGYSGDNIMFRFGFYSANYLMFGGSCGVDTEINAGVMFDDVIISGCFMGTLEEN